MRAERFLLLLAELVELVSVSIGDRDARRDLRWVASPLPTRRRVRLVAQVLLVKASAEALFTGSARLRLQVLFKGCQSAGFPWDKYH